MSKHAVELCPLPNGREYGFAELWNLCQQTVMDYRPSAHAKAATMPTVLGNRTRLVEAQGGEARIGVGIVDVPPQCSAALAIHEFVHFLVPPKNGKYHNVDFHDALGACERAWAAVAGFEAGAVCTSAMRCPSQEHREAHWEARADAAMELEIVIGDLRTCQHVWCGVGEAYIRRALRRLAKVQQALEQIQEAQGA